MPRVSADDSFREEPPAPTKVDKCLQLRYSFIFFQKPGRPLSSTQTVNDPFQSPAPKQKHPEISAKLSEKEETRIEPPALQTSAPVVSNSTNHLEETQPRDPVDASTKTTSAISSSSKSSIPPANVISKPGTGVSG